MPFVFFFFSREREEEQDQNNTRKKSSIIERKDKKTKREGEKIIISVFRFSVSGFRAFRESFFVLGFFFSSVE